MISETWIVPTLLICNLTQNLELNAQTWLKQAYDSWLDSDIKTHDSVCDLFQTSKLMTLDSYFKASDLQLNSKLMILDSDKLMTHDPTQTPKLMTLGSDKLVTHDSTRKKNT